MQYLSIDKLVSGHSGHFHSSMRLLLVCWLLVAKLAINTNYGTFAASIVRAIYAYFRFVSWPGVRVVVGICTCAITVDFQVYQIAGIILDMFNMYATAIHWLSPGLLLR